MHQVWVCSVPLLLWLTSSGWVVACVALRGVGVVGSLCEGPFALGVGFVPHPLHFHLPIVFCVFGDVCTGER